MKAAVFHGPRELAVENVDDPKIEKPLDAVIRITTANIGTAFEKGVSIVSGQRPVKRYGRELRDLIIVGRATPSFIVSHESGLDEAPKAYEQFDARADGWAKVLLHPAA